MNIENFNFVLYDNSALFKTIDYVSGYVYENSKLDFFFQDEGRIKKLASGALRYEYNIKDHLGNTRVMFADTNSDNTADLLEESHYYAFGSRIEGLSSSNIKNKFTYNGKELEDDHGLNWYHYGLRYYDPQIGRWYSIDPKDELASPYNFVANNPIRLIDPDGTQIDVINETAKGASFTGSSFTQSVVKDIYYKSPLVAAGYDKLMNNNKIFTQIVGSNNRIQGQYLDNGQRINGAACLFPKLQNDGTINVLMIIPTSGGAVEGLNRNVQQAFIHELGHLLNDLLPIAEMKDKSEQQKAFEEFIQNYSRNTTSNEQKALDFENRAYNEWFKSDVTNIDSKPDMFHLWDYDSETKQPRKSE